MKSIDVSSPMVWDPLVRLCHWSLTGFFFVAYVVENDWPGMHSHAGYTVALLVAFRLIWGMIGPRHAKFSSFFVGPAKTFRYLGALARGKASASAGHDPAGAVMILLLLLGLLVTTVSGMILFAMEGSGPLANTFVESLPGPLLVDIHHFASEATFWLVVVHVLGVLIMSFRNRQNLVRAMITGRK
jgi:cytochrome b